ncbi:hypothetical protein [Polaribacter porphyrae]|nr:hypothetical protein [Polaribacter porphyrae]
MKIVSKSIFTLLTAATLLLFISCESNEEAIPETIETKTELLESGEWLLKGFEDRVMYTFVNGERATYYGENDIFPNEPIPGKHAYSFQDDKITIDLNFGNIYTYEIKFSCDNNIIQFYNDKGELNSALYRKGSNYQQCL